MHAGRSLVLSLIVLVAVSAFAATWEGTAIVGVSSDFPDNGLSAACNSFPKDSTIELRNLENGKLVQVTISGGLDNPGVFIVLSPLAASELGMKTGVSSRIRATVVPASSLPSPDTATASRSQDPDFNPTLLAKADGTVSTNLPVVPSPGASLVAPLPSGGGGTNADSPASASSSNPASPPTPGFEPERAKVIGGTNPASPATPAPAPTEAPSQSPLPEVSQPILPASAGTVPAPSSQNPAPSAQNTTPPDRAAVLGGDTPSSPSEPSTTAGPLAQATEPALPPGESGVVIGGDQPESPAVPSPTPGLSDTPIPAPAAPSESGAGAATAPPTTPTPVPTTAPSGQEQVLSLETSSPRPPPSTEGPAPATPANTATAAPPPASPPTRQPLMVEALDKDAFYVQVAVFSSDQGLAQAAGALDSSWPLTSEKIAGAKGEQYRLFIGPLARDESGLFILKLRSMGFRDAFLRRGQ